MDQSPCWEANSHSSSQEIPRPSWNPKAYYHVRKSPPLLSILRHMGAAHSIQTYYTKNPPIYA
jgi:hypothetical protein